jgi:hypothetical protein
MRHGPILPGTAQGILLAALIGVGLVIGYELWRRRARPGQVTPEQFRRRLIGGVLLEIDLLLWLGADLLIHRWPPAWQLLYLLGATLLVFVPVYLALRETGYIVRQYARSRADLVRSLGRAAERHDPSGNGAG